MLHDLHVNPRENVFPLIALRAIKVVMIIAVPSSPIFEEYDHKPPKSLTCPDKIFFFHANLKILRTFGLRIHVKRTVIKLMLLDELDGMSCLVCF